MPSDRPVIARPHRHHGSSCNARLGNVCNYQEGELEEVPSTSLSVIDAEELAAKLGVFTVYDDADLGEALDQLVAAAEREGDAATIAACRAFRGSVEFAPELAGEVLGWARDALRGALAAADRAPEEPKVPDLGEVAGEEIFAPRCVCHPDYACTCGRRGVRQPIPGSNR